MVYEIIREPFYKVSFEQSLETPYLMFILVIKRQ